MIICICNNVSDKKIYQIKNDENKIIITIKDLQKEIVICNQCCKCKNDINHILNNNIKK